MHRWWTAECVGYPIRFRMDLFEPHDVELLQKHEVCTCVVVRMCSCLSNQLSSYFGVRTYAAKMLSLLWLNVIFALPHLSVSRVCLCLLVPYSLSVFPHSSSVGHILHESIAMTHLCSPIVWYLTLAGVPTYSVLYVNLM